MTREHLPDTQGDAHFLLSAAQVLQLGEVIVQFGQRFGPRDPGTPAPDAPAWRPRITLLSTGPAPDSWHRTTHLDDGPADVTIEAWYDTRPPYCHDRGVHTAGHTDRGLGVTMREDGAIQRAYLNTDGSAWLSHLKLVEDVKGGRVWREIDRGGADEALAFAGRAFARYLGTTLQVAPREVPPPRQHWLTGLLRSLVSSVRIRG